MAQNSLDFIESVATVINALSSTPNVTILNCTPNTTNTAANHIPNHSLCIEAQKGGNNKFYMTVGSDSSVDMTFNSNNTGFSKEPRVLSASPCYSGMKRIEYGKNTVSNIANDIAVL